MDPASWDERHRDEERFSHREPNRFVVGAVKPLEPGRALVLAAGQGHNAVWLAEQGWEVTAIDFSEVALEKAAALADERRVEIECRVADLLEWEPDAVYDLVTIVYLQLPAGGRHEVWQKAVRAVGPGGHLLVVGHDSRNLEEGYGGPSQAAVLYTASEVVAVVGEDLEVGRSETVVRPVEVENEVRYAIDNLVMAARPSA